MSQDSIVNQKKKLDNMEAILLEYRNKITNINERIEHLQESIDNITMGRRDLQIVKEITAQLLDRSLTRFKRKSVKRMEKWQYDTEMNKVNRHIESYCKYIDAIDREVKKYESKDLLTIKPDTLLITRGILELYRNQAGVYLKHAKKVYNTAVNRYIEDEMRIR